MIKRQTRRISGVALGLSLAMASFYTLAVTNITTGQHSLNNIQTATADGDITITEPCTLTLTLDNPHVQVSRDRIKQKAHVTNFTITPSCQSYVWVQGAERDSASGATIAKSADQQNQLLLNISTSVGGFSKWHAASQSVVSTDKVDANTGVTGRISIWEKSGDNVPAGKYTYQLVAGYWDN